MFYLSNKIVFDMFWKVRARFTIYIKQYFQECQSQIIIFLIQKSIKKLKSKAKIQNKRLIT